MMLEVAERFHADAGERGEFCPDTMSAYFRRLMATGFLYVSKRGLIGAVLFDSPWSKDHLLAMTIFLRAEDGHGMGLFRAYEAWAKEKGAVEKRSGYCHAVMPERTEAFLRHLGYETLETIMVK